MGNRAIITIENTQGKIHPVALYLHWNGGLESVEAFMQVAYEAPTNDQSMYGFHAVLCQLTRNYFKDGLSFYAYPVADVPELEKACCNGHYHYRVGKDAPQLITWTRQLRHLTISACVEKARSHKYWTGEDSILSTLRAALPSKDIEPENTQADSDYRISITWRVEDVQEVRPDLSREQAAEVLREVERTHDACFGVNWDALECAADALFPNHDTDETA